MTLLHVLSCFLFIAGGSAAVTGAYLELQAVTWKNTALLLGGLSSIAGGMALSRQKRRHQP